MRERIFPLEGSMSKCCVAAPAESKDDGGSGAGAMLGGRAGRGGVAWRGSGRGPCGAPSSGVGQTETWGQKKSLEVAL